MVIATIFVAAFGVANFICSHIMNSKFYEAGLERESVSIYTHMLFGSLHSGFLLALTCWILCYFGI